MTSSAPLSEPGRLAAAVIVLLIAATAAAFFAAQRLKREPPLLRQRASDQAFSPNGDGVKDSARIRFELPRRDDVTVTILDADGGRVARVVRNRSLPQGRVVTLRWDGRTDEGDTAPEGDYRVRVGLRREGRTNTLAHTIVLDLTPPRPTLEALDAPDSGPVILDGRERRRVTVELTGARRSPRYSVWRTDLRRPRKVVRRLPTEGPGRARWDGRIGGRQAPSGTYLLAVESRDRAGNLGSAPEVLPPPRAGTVPGAVGVTVRPLSLRPPRAPVIAGRRTLLPVDAGGRRYAWTLRRVGASRRVSSGSSAARWLPVRIPRRGGGVYMLTVRSSGHRARTVIPVTGARRSRILVVLPFLTWQGRNEVDDDGDGLPDSLPRERPAALDRPLARGALPHGFASQQRPLFDFLEREGLRYDVTTDATLARSRVGDLRAHRAVVLAGDLRWLPRPAGTQLRAFVRRGGRLLSLGIDSLRRTVEVTGGVLRSPSERAGVDFLRARVRPPVDEPVELSAESDTIGIFFGLGGALGSWSRWEETASVGPGRLVAAGSSTGRRIFVAYELGRGLVIRPGVGGFPASLDDSGSPAPTMMRRIWTLLRG